MANFALLFIFFGVAGWVIDSAYRSITSKRWESGTQIMFFSPIYAIGGLVLVFVFNLDIHIIVQLIIATALLTLLELLSGIFSEKVMKKRYWDYSRSKWNYNGHIDALHSFYWLILSIAAKIIFPYLPI